MGSPPLVWMVAPVTIPTASGAHASWNEKRCSSMDSTTVDSITANWSPTHLRMPPPNGM